MKTPQEYLSRGTGNCINCTDYDDAIAAMHEYAKTVSEQRDKEIEEKNKAIEELRGCLQELFIAYILDVDSEGEPHSSIGRPIEISTNAKNLLEKHKLNN